MKRREDQRRREYQCAINDLVWVSSKFYPQLRANCKQSKKYYGPYLVAGLHGLNAVVLKGMPPQVLEVVNLSFIKPFRDSPTRFESRPEANVTLPFQGDSLKGTRIGTRADSGYQDLTRELQV